MRQMTLAHQAKFQRYSKKTRREQFLSEMDAVMTWAALLALLASQIKLSLTHDERSGTVITF
jgi:hypothetical protein